MSRKLPPEQRVKTIGLTIHPALLAELDKHHENDRSRLICEIIRSYLTNTKPKVDQSA